MTFIIAVDRLLRLRVVFSKRLGSVVANKFNSTGAVGLLSRSEGEEEGRRLDWSREIVEGPAVNMSVTVTVG